MAATGVYINVKKTATGEVKQVNVYNSTTDVDDGMYKMLTRTWKDESFNVGEEDCYIAVTDNENSQEYKDYYSGWSFDDPKMSCVGTTNTRVHVLTEAGAPFSMYNWAWANYQQVTGQNHVTLTNFDTAYTPSQKQLSRVNNAANAFVNCQNLTDVSPFAGLCAYGSAVNFSYMFQNCRNITNLDSLAGWNTANVTNMANMFYYCNNLTDITPLANWDTGNTSDMGEMFRECNSLTNIDALSGWDVGKATRMSHMFNNCRNLDTVNLPNWNTGNVTTFGHTFYNCYSLKTLNLANWDTTNVTDFNQMFYSCFNLTTLNLAGWTISPEANIYQMFSTSSRQTNATNFSHMFYNCKNLTTLNLANWDTGNVTDMDYMFYSCYNIVDINWVANWNTGKVTSMAYMFSSCRNVVNFDALSGWNTSSLENTGYMLSHIFYLSDASFLRKWNMASMTSAIYMLFNCQNLTCVTLPDSLANTVNCNVVNMFRNCVNLAGNIFFNGAYVNNAANCFSGANNYIKNIVANRKVANGTYEQFYKSMGNAKFNSSWNANLYPLDPTITFNLIDEAGGHGTFKIDAAGQMSTQGQGTVIGDDSYVYTGVWGDKVTYTVTGDGYETVTGTVDLLLDDMSVDIHMYGEQHHYFTADEVLVGLDGGTIPMASWLDTTATNYNCVFNAEGSDTGYASWASMMNQMPSVGTSQTTYSVKVEAWDAGEATMQELETGRRVLVDSTGTFEDGTSQTTSMYVRQTSEAPNEYLVHNNDLEVSEWGKMRIDITGCYDTNLTSLAYDTTDSWIEMDVIVTGAKQTVTVNPNLTVYANPFGGAIQTFPMSRTGTVSVTGTYSSGATKTITFSVEQNGGYDNYFYAKEIKLDNYEAKDIYLDSDYVVSNATDYVPADQLSWCEIAVESSSSGDKMMVLKVKENTGETEREGVINLYVTFAQSEYEQGETIKMYSISVYQPGAYNTGGGANPDPVEPDPGYDGPDET